MQRHSFVGLFLVIITLAVYFQVHNFEFIDYDDDLYITKNPEIQRGLTPDSIRWAFTTQYGATWQPLTWLSFMLDQQFFGLNPRGYHLTNVFLHVLNTLLLFLIMNRMTQGFWQSAFIAAVFAVHPLHVESVAWVAERKDVLSTLFWLLAMRAYVYFLDRPSISRYSLIVLAFALGLMAKPMLVTLPFVLLLLDFWPLRRIRYEELAGRNFKSLWKLVREKAPLFVLVAFSSTITYFAQKGGGAVIVSSLGGRISNALVSYIRYIKKTIWPLDLAVFYPHPGNTLPAWQIIGAVLLLALISALTFVGAKRRPYLIVGWLWYLGTLVPVIGIVQIAGQAMADRFTYIPMIGLSIMIAWGLPDLMERSAYKRAIITFGAVISIVVMIGLAWSQVRYWRDSIILFDHALRVTSNNYWAHYSLGIYLGQQGKLDESIDHLRQAVAIEPNHYLMHDNLGIALETKGLLEEAMSHYLEAARIKPDYEVAHYNMGRVLVKVGNYDEAVARYSMALKIKPEFVSAQNDLGHVLAEQGKYEDAASRFSQALKYDPRNEQTHANLGVVLERLGKFDEAAAHFSETLKINPNSELAHNSFGAALARRGKFEEAILHFSRAVEINPANERTRYNLGLAYNRLGRVDDAIREFEAIVRVNPQFSEARQQLENALHTKGIQ